MNSNSSLDLFNKLKAALVSRQKMTIIDDKRIPAAVLIPVYTIDGKTCMLFTRRTELVRHHKGEISFPGGGLLAEDGTLLNAALRESYEEIGLNPVDVDILGELDDILTKGSNFVVTPFIGTIYPNYQYKLNAFETAEVIEIPVDELLQAGARRQEPPEVIGGILVTPYIYANQNHRITGATARILKQFLDIFTQVTAAGGDSRI